MYTKSQFKPYAQLAIAICRSAIHDGDYEFFDTDWGKDIVEIANSVSVMTREQLKKLAMENCTNNIFLM